MKSNYEGSMDVALDVTPALFSDVTITWSVKDNTSITITNNQLTIDEVSETLNFTLVATISAGEKEDTKEFATTVLYVDSSATVLATFDFGANGNAAHVDGNGLSDGATYTDGSYELKLTGISKVYGPAYDAKGNSCIKLGTSSLTGTFSFTVPQNVTSVVIYVAGYKAATSTNLTINGVSYNVKTLSNNGEYTALKIDTTTVKTVTFTTVTYRAMINTIEFIG